MNRIDLLLHALDASYETEAWHPPLSAALAGVTAAQASWRPAGEAANTIWETVNHLLYYKERLLERLRGGKPTYSAPNNDATFTGDVTAADEAAWQAAVARMAAVHRGLREALAARADADLDQPADNPLGHLLADIISHDAYHTGQIIQIRKLQGSWPAQRSFS